MGKTFVCDESMVITIPLGNLADAGVADLMPETFTCAFKDFYKVFVSNGKPKPVGAAQAIGGVFLCCLGVLLKDLMFALAPALFVVAGLLSYATGKGPNMLVAKLSFSLNIISTCWSLVAFILCLILILPGYPKVESGPIELMMALLVVECFLSLFLIYWLSKAICRQHFNILPIILLKQGE